jgi:hypothetical protein
VTDRNLSPMPELAPVEHAPLSVELQRSPMNFSRCARRRCPNLSLRAGASCISYAEVPVEPSHHLQCGYGSGVVCCFLDELYAGGQAEFGVHVGEVGLHRPR